MARSYIIHQSGWVSKANLLFQSTPLFFHSIASRHTGWGIGWREYHLPLSPRCAAWWYTAFRCYSWSAIVQMCALKCATSRVLSWVRWNAKVERVCDLCQTYGQNVLSWSKSKSGRFRGGQNKISTQARPFSHCVSGVRRHISLGTMSWNLTPSIADLLFCYIQKHSVFPVTDKKTNCSTNLHHHVRRRATVGDCSSISAFICLFLCSGRHVCLVLHWFIYVASLAVRLFCWKTPKCVCFRFLMLHL